MCPQRQIIIFLLTVCLSCYSYQLVLLNGTEYKNQKVRSLYTLNCTEDNDCIVNSYCYYGRCTCKSGFIPDKDSRRGPVKCIKEAVDIDDYCEKDIQCAASFGTHAICRKFNITDIVGKCTCNDESHFIDNLCYTNSYIGQRCQVNNNCYIRNRDIQSYCDYGHCICPPNYHAIDGGKDCVSTSVLYGPCLTSDNCLTFNSECINGFCSCRKDYTNKFDNSSCIPVAKQVGDTCDEDRQCSFYIQNSRCYLKEATCTCHDGYHAADGNCWVSKNLLDRCNHTNECRPIPLHEGLHCYNNICQCMNGYAMDGGNYCTKYDNETKKSANQGTLNTISSYILIGLIFISIFVNKSD